MLEAASLEHLDPRPTIVIASGFYELLLDGSVLARSMAITRRMLGAGDDLRVGCGICGFQHGHRVERVDASCRAARTPLIGRSALDGGRSRVVGSTRRMAVH